MKENAVAIIPARGGSKGIPGKNLAMLNGSPLLAYTIHAAQKSEIFRQIYVSSDDPEILQCAKKYGAAAISRPSELSQDNSTSHELITHFLDTEKIKDQTLCLLQPTSPFREASHVQEAYEEYISRDRQPVYSVCVSDHCVFKGLGMQADGSMSGYFGQSAPFQPRQNFPELYFTNGAIYFFSRQAFETGHQIPMQRFFPYAMDKLSSFDIDEPMDLVIAEAVAKNKNFSL